ncbi:MAG: DNA gyrase C-terminal beta-propeller domain-containing protein, partial [Oscillospiraceae bacterium]
ADDGVIIRIPAAQINMQSRYAGGVRVMRLSEGSTVVAIEAVPHEEEAEEDLIPNLDADDEEQEQEENQENSEE